ncbi:MAG: diaminopimelate decarboxylase family protein, partial [Candidatus Dormibacteraceae bacterium]
LYTVGAIKDVPGGLRYVGIDGGMGDNIRPKLYGAKYTAVSAHQPLAETMQQVTIAGKYCESTDLLIEDVRLPQLKAGELLCVPACGAYTLSESLSYNGIPRPEAVLVGNGQARVIRRRETLEDLLKYEVF